MKRKSERPKKCSECGKLLRSHNKSLLCEYHIKQKYREEHKELFRKIRRRYYEKNRKEIIRKQTEYNQRADIKLKIKGYSKTYRENNKEKIRNYMRKYGKEYYQKKKLQEQNKQNLNLLPLYSGGKDL